MYGDSNVITSNKDRKNLNVTKQRYLPCPARDKPLSQKRQKCRWRTNVKKTNMFMLKAVASGTIVSSTVSVYKPRRTVQTTKLKEQNDKGSVR